MFSKREMPGLADTVATIISPVLIMAMIGALIFFLVEVLFGGEFAGRLRWTFFFFVFGSVLVARISIEFGDARAGIYAAVLGVAAIIAMCRFVEFPPGLMEQIGPVINIGLLALVWWSARKLTWDCTYIDDRRDASDQSLLEASGLDQLERPEEWREPEPIPEEPEKPTDPGPIGWVQRYLNWRKRQDRKPHTPGVWVVYFSLAALPIFGLGQSLIDPEDGSSRQFTFWLMVVYVGSGLGLLMTTAFLGLRRYLKQRKVSIPASMAGLWLGLGSALIVGFLALAAILPRPNSETPLVEITGATSKERDASQYAAKGDGRGQGDGAGGDEKSEDAKSNSSVEGKSKEGGKGKGQEDANKGSGDNKGKNGDSGKSDKSGDQKGGDKSGEKGEKGDPKQGDKNENKSGSGSQSKKDSQSSKARSSKSRSGSTRGPVSMGSLGRIGTIIKWIVFIALALVVGYFVFRHGLKFLANFTTWARQLLDWLNNFWTKLFGGTVTEREPDTIEDFANVQKPARPFSDFSNPFETGEAARLSPDELVRYSFTALEAWAWEHDKSRGPHETPIEFAHRLSELYESLQEEAPRLATLYARLAYARGALPEASRARVEEFWRHLELAQDEALHGPAEVVAEI